MGSFFLKHNLLLKHKTKQKQKEKRKTQTPLLAVFPYILFHLLSARTTLLLIAHNIRQTWQVRLTQ